MGVGGRAAAPDRPGQAQRLPSGDVLPPAGAASGAGRGDSVGDVSHTESTVKQIPLTKGLVAIVDDEDYERVSIFKWNAGHNERRTCYAQRATRDKTIMMHRFILGAQDEQEVDHIDGDGLNNQKSNLRLCSRRENQWHKRGWAPSGFKGVYPMGKKWRAVITAYGHKHYLGCFDSPVAAARMYDQAARQLHGDFAYLNFPEELKP